MSTAFYNATVISPFETLRDAAVVVSDEGLIEYVGPQNKAPFSNDLRIDLRNRILAPGFNDVHTHGGHGVTFGYDDLGAGLADYSRWATEFGVTGFLTSIAAANPEAEIKLIKQYADLFESGYEGAVPLGMHLEGPFLNAEKKGAFDPAWLHAPSASEVEAYIEAGRGWIRQVTMAPELPNALEAAAIFRQAGVVVSMGHTNTDFDTASAALRGNFTHVTHTFNAQRSFDHRAPGVMGAVLDSDEVTTELIADTIHVHPGAMKVLLRCVGPERVVLITDAMAGAGLSDGTYQLVGYPVQVKNGHATLENGTIAGSTATLDQCVRNMAHIVGAPLQQAVRMASWNPARAMGLTGITGSVEVGKPANLIVIDEQVRVYLTMVKGRVVYSAM